MGPAVDRGEGAPYMSSDHQTAIPAPPEGVRGPDPAFHKRPDASRALRRRIKDLSDG